MDERGVQALDLKADTPDLVPAGLGTAYSRRALLCRLALVLWLDAIVALSFRAALRHLNWQAGVAALASLLG